MMAGWTKSTFDAFDKFFWIPWIVPHFGGIVGAFIYMCMVGGHHTADDSGVVCRAPLVL